MEQELALKDLGIGMVTVGIGLIKTEAAIQAILMAGIESVGHYRRNGNLYGEETINQIPGSHRDLLLLIFRKLIGTGIETVIGNVHFQEAGEAGLTELEDLMWTHIYPATARTLAGQGKIAQGKTAGDEMIEMIVDTTTEIETG